MPNMVCTGPFHRETYARLAGDLGCGDPDTCESIHTAGDDGVRTASVLLDAVRKKNPQALFNVIRIYTGSDLSKKLPSSNRKL